MKKILLVVSLALILVFGGIKILLPHLPKKELELRLKAATLPDLTLSAIDGTRTSLIRGKPIVLIYFNSTCDHCQRQVEALKSNLGLFESISVVLMSAQPLEDVIAFAATLTYSDNLTIVRCKPEEISAKFGVLSLPQIFVYDADGALAGLFYGETNPRTIVAALGH
jgi:peroxiredoxin